MGAKAKIQRYKPVRVGDIVTRERARLDCGCTVYVGRSAGMEPATRASACCEEHLVITELFNTMLTASLAEPSKRELVVVCAQLLSKAAREAT